MVKNSSTGFLFLWGISTAARLAAHTVSATEINGREARLRMPSVRYPPPHLLEGPQQPPFCIWLWLEKDLGVTSVVPSKTRVSFMLSHLFSWRIVYVHCVHVRMCVYEVTAHRADGGKADFSASQSADACVQSPWGLTSMSGKSLRTKKALKT